MLLSVSEVVLSMTQFNLDHDVQVHNKSINYPYPPTETYVLPVIKRTGPTVSKFFDEVYMKPK